MYLHIINTTMSVRTNVVKLQDNLDIPKHPLPNQVKGQSDVVVLEQ